MARPIQNPNSFYKSKMTSNSFLSWRGILAGFFIATWTYALLVALGFAIGGLTFEALSLESIQEFSTLGAIWIIVSIMISLFVGAYLSSRTSFIFSSPIGAMQGATTAAVFFFVMVLTASLGIGALTIGAGNLAGTSVQMSKSVLSQPIVRNTIEDSLGNIELNRPSPQIVQGIAARMLNGNFESAKNYLITHSNISESEANRRLSSLRTQFSSAVEEAKDAIGDFLTAIGWSCFAMFLLGGLSAFFGGALGARRNTSKSLVETSPSGFRQDEERQTRMAG